jgi:hypothetical protein
MIGTPPIALLAAFSVPKVFVVGILSTTTLALPLVEKSIKFMPYNGVYQTSIVRQGKEEVYIFHWYGTVKLNCDIR